MLAQKRHQKRTIQKSMSDTMTETQEQPQNMSLDSLQSDDARQLMDTVDRLRKAGLGSIIQLPQIVTVGDQSSGKSSIGSSVAISVNCVFRPLDRDMLGIEPLRKRLSKLLHQHLTDELPELQKELDTKQMETCVLLEMLGQSQIDK